MPLSTATSANQANERALLTRILITGSAQGLGRAAATTLLDDGHQVVVHARDTSRAAALTDLVDRGAAVVIGDLASAQQTRHLAEQVNQLGRMDAVIHHAGVYGDRDPNPGPEGHPRVLAVRKLRHRMRSPRRHA